MKKMMIDLKIIMKENRDKRVMNKIKSKEKKENMNTKKMMDMENKGMLILIKLVLNI